MFYTFQVVQDFFHQQYQHIMLMDNGSIWLPGNWLLDMCSGIPINPSYWNVQHVFFTCSSHGLPIWHNEFPWIPIKVSLTCRFSQECFWEYIGYWIHWLIEWLIEWLNDWLNDWMIDWMIDRLIDLIWFDLIRFDLIWFDWLMFVPTQIPFGPSGIITAVVTHSPPTW